MKRVAAIKAAGEWTGPAADRVVLDADDRQRRRVVFRTERGTDILLDMPQPVMLRDGDGLLLEGGSIVAVAGAPEPLAEVAANSPHEFLRLAWHLGNRHTDVQIVGRHIRIRRDHVLEEMLRGLGAQLTTLDAPFDPEPGAHNAHGHSHGNGHGA
jgi:urease accessory protein